MIASQNSGVIEFVHPSTMLIAGPTGSGKSNFVVRLLDEHMYEKAIDKVFWYYREWQPLFQVVGRRHANIQFIQHLPSSFDHLDVHDNNLIIIDDLMTDSGASDDVQNLFAVGSHHRNASVILITQNLFDRGKASRSISLNSHYIVLLKNPRDKGQIRAFAAQFSPSQTRYVVEAYEDATASAYSYLLIDCRPETPDEFRIRTQIFRTDAGGDGTVVYKPIPTKASAARKRV